MVYLRNAEEVRGSYDGKIRFTVVLKLLLGRADEKLMNEQVLACEGVDDTELTAAPLISAGKAIKYENLAVLKISDHLVPDSVEILRLDRPVHRPPAYLVMNTGSVSDELILGRTSGILSRRDRQCACIGQCAFASAKSNLNKPCG